MSEYSKDPIWIRAMAGLQQQQVNTQLSKEAGWDEIKEFLEGAAIALGVSIPLVGGSLGGLLLGTHTRDIPAIEVIRESLKKKDAGQFTEDDRAQLQQLIDESLAAGEQGEQK